MRFVCLCYRMSTERKPFPVRLNDEEIQQIDNLRRAEIDIPTRSERVRRIIDRAAAKQEKRK